MAMNRRNRHFFQIAIATLLVLALAPLLLMIISRDPSLIPLSDPGGIQGGHLLQMMPHRGRQFPWEMDEYAAPANVLSTSHHRPQNLSSGQLKDSSEHQAVTPRNSPAELKETLGNYEPNIPAPRRSGVGENGIPAKLLASEQALYDQSYKEYGFNMVVSDRISLDRAVPDIRDPQCKYWHYPATLPSTSVVVVFHNEGWSTLMRTVHSIINMTPSFLLREIVMVDDFSEKEHLKESLEEYIAQPQFEGKVKLFRNTKREGLIRSRITGAQRSRGDVITFLDAHCECNVNWLPPLLAEIAADRRVVVCPTVDAIEADTFAYGPQVDGLCRGAFDWEFWYKRIHVTYSKDRLGMKYSSQSYDSPVMAGGLFAIDRSYFFQLGGYDPGLQIWGGENFEISFKIWMCGGRLKFVPCSRVGHIYRKGVPYTYPDLGTGVSVVRTNYMRVAEVWLDEYKDFFYANQPELRGKPYGNITEQINFRRQHCPKSFDWFMKEVAFDTLERFPPPPVNRLWGQIRGLYSDICLDTMGREETDGRLGASRCHGLGGNQLFRLNVAGELAIHSYCLVPAGHRVISRDCSHVGKTALWEFDEGTGQFRENNTSNCIHLNMGTFEVTIQDCDINSSAQKFQIAPPTPR
ncbi:N-acetylgalactosaminyltransferase 7-like [Acanthaster planci]|uniref:Polypeptide N-acetylgalactosaminyltransferase n=1 Tax=Acanthaster planci TaxID=133434 RepID=A0A8B7YPV0_ACAPL|nr:N-acetylgalactosaminyltransferase 7-like [Acanthaster planci]XP_022094707.1 N-acetylgalactosaminyltransferase 7-like [Acanthaster planci]